MYVRVFFLIITSIFILFGCQQNNDNALPNENADDSDQYRQVRNSSPDNHQDLNNNEIANRLAHIASDIPSVNDAAAIVAGPYAVVGIDVDKELDRSRVGTIKYSVSEALYHDPYGKTAVVVADADVTERLRLMGQSIQDGRPVQGVVEELAAIVGRYMPDFPIMDDRPNEPDQNKEIMENEEENKLDDIQQEQSNHHKD